MKRFILESSIEVCQVTWIGSALADDGWNDSEIVGEKNNIYKRINTIKNWGWDKYIA